MQKVLPILAILIYVGLTFKLPIHETSTVRSSQAISQNLGDTIKYNGKGFTADLQSVLAEAISDSVIYFKDSFYSQATYISKQLKTAKAGDWHVVIIQNLTITKITDVSTGFYYWTEADTWALWYDASNFAKNLLHLVMYNGNSGKDVVNVTTKDSSVGSDISAETAKVISSIVQTLDTTQDIAKYIQKYDGQKWSVLSVPFLWGTQYP